MKWVVLHITLPQKPSRVRVALWRRLKTAGAANIVPSVWVLPVTDAHIKEMAEIISVANESGGRGFLSRSEFAGGKDNDDIISLFNAERNAEYMEFIEKCDNFYYELKKETEKQNFSFAELEENEHELEKLKTWLEKIMRRDFFGDKEKDKAKVALAEGKKRFKVFSDKVYAANEEN